MLCCPASPRIGTINRRHFFTSWTTPLFDFEFTPARDEFLWNANAELRKYFSETLSAALVMDYDNFDSENPIFAAERFLTGCVVKMRF